MSIAPSSAPSTDHPHVRSLRRRWMAPFLFAALPLALVACGKSASQAGPAGGQMPPPEVSVVTVQAQSHSVELEYVGQTAGSRETEVRARVAGILNKRLFEEGATVKAGTPLFQIDPSNFQTQVASAEANVAVAQAKVNQARRDQARLVPLIAEKAISQKEFDDSKSALESAEASLKQAQAQANEARLNLGYTKVVAPISGTTGTASKSDGSLVTASDSLLTTIVQTNPIYVNFSISESDLLRMTKQVSSGQLAVPGQRSANGSLGFSVNVKLADGSLYPRTGKLNFASEKVNPTTGSFDARAEIPNPDGSLRPGQFVRVLLGGASRPNSISVPQRAVIDSPMGKIVFLVTPDNKLAPRPVELDGWTKGEWIVTKGVQSGDRVLVEGFIKAHEPGMTVKPVPYVAKAADGKPPVAPAAAEKPPAAPASAASAAAK
ncbi:membrane fusion protein (multidrug efflux system) [Rhodoferax ferrireducens]|uniref:Membrane fusion protein (Multidrug efflux system) n=2 Tax=Rhodoferax ferrireducens TaxID=192843 RepID=A0ABU2C7D8_9BURK|nr:membrane fusion protein (multidrug efflux system) [Rhodoferax ferrireducens]